MSVLLFVLANVIVLAGSVSVVRIARARAPLHIAVIIALWYFAQIIGSLLLAGAALRQLEPYTVLLVNLAITEVMAIIATFVAGPVTRKTLHGVRVYAQALAGYAQELLQDSWATGLVLIAALEAGWLALIGYLYPTYDSDGLGYHLVAVANWIQHSAITLVPPAPFEIWANVYPMNTELYFTWLVLFFHNDTLVNLGQLVFAIGGIAAVAGIARVTGLGRTASLAAGALFFLTPIVLAQSTTNYVDVSSVSLCLMTFYFLYRHLQTPHWSNLLFAGMSGGLAIGAKSSNVLFVAVSVAVLVGVALYRRKLSVRAIALAALLLGAPVALFGAYWYVRTWVVYGSPVYPFTVALAGHVIFPGQGTVNQLIMNPQTPSVLAPHSWWQKIYLSWRNEPPRDVGFGSTGFYSYDKRLGGFGPQWTYIELPLFIGLVGYALWKRRALFFTFLLPFIVIFLLEPANWWTRYTIFIVVPGAVALAYVMEKTPAWWIRGALHIATLACVMLSLYFASTQWIFASRTIGQAVVMGSSHRTVGALFIPDFAWVDQVPQGSTIGFTDIPGNDRGPYPFYGSSLRNHVYGIRASSEEAFLQTLQADGVQYLFTTPGSAYAQWADAAPTRFKLIFSSQTARVYTFQ